MAEPEHPSATWSIPQQQGQDIPAPNYLRDYPFSRGPDFNNPPHNPPNYAPASQPHHLPLSHGQPLPFQPYQYRQTYPIGFAENPNAMFPYNPTARLASQTLPPQGNRHEPSTYPMFNEEWSTNEPFGTQNTSRYHHPGFDQSSYVAPLGRPNSQWPPQPPQFFAQRLAAARPALPVDAVSPGSSTAEAAFEGTNNLGDSRTDESQLSPYMRMRASYQRMSRQGIQDSSNQERRPSSRPGDGSSPMPDFTSSPRHSNRRNFDRYSTDLPTDAEQNGPRRSPASRAADRTARRQRPLLPPTIRRLSSQTEHPNVPSAEQMQKLRDKLRHLLPIELPEGVDTMCDICQKDYSAKHVDPSEDDEVAIQLPCKHVFGEHCINTWFDTCKKHKNKITCPMCRKVLVEPKPRPAGSTPRQLLERLERLQSRELLEAMPRASRERLLSMLQARVDGELSTPFGPDGFGEF